MDYLIICCVALLGSGLTLFSGFGLGTLLIPTFGIFFPVDIAIALTAIVHFFNNLFKLAFLGKQADRSIIIKFGIPSVFAALLGAYVLNLLTHIPPLIQYTTGEKSHEITAVKLTMALLLVFFALFDTMPALSGLRFNKKFMALGGLLSGFFGGLSGMQGALRSAFLIRADLTKETFIATGAVIACLVDISRLSLYARHMQNIPEGFQLSIIVAATLSAFLGVYLGSKYLKKVTLKTLQYIVAVMLCVFAVLMGTGLI